jgi:hypothetical protein
LIRQKSARQAPDWCLEDDPMVRLAWRCELLNNSLLVAAMDGRSAKQLRKQLICRESVRTCAGRAT